MRGELTQYASLPKFLFMKKYIVFVLFLSAFTALQAQDLYPEKFSDCHQTRFSFCLDCGDPKASYDGDLVGYFNSVFKKSARKMSGKAFVQVIIDSAGHQCVKSLQHDAGVDVRKLRLKDEINAMTGWHAAVKKGKPVSSSRVMVFSFADGDLSISFRDFDSKNTKNMLSVGKVEISDPSKYKNNLNDKLFHVYTTQNSKVPWDMSRSVSIDQDGTVFQGTDNGIVQVKDGVMTVINQGNSGLRGSNADGGRTTTVMASAVDAQNNKWFSGGYAV
ncbi:MAG: hypothetical protein CFE23_16275 [Flavobacterium sp. BFFFF1]|nr:MAG: hypothetical protein CFE23_16275 [Flavobacterium sp. BFFFF1]